MLKKTVLLVVGFIAVFLCATYGALANTYEIDNINSRVGFKIRRLSSDVEGEFTRFGGTIQLDPFEVTPSQVAATIDVTSIDTKADERDLYLKSRSFLDAQKFPHITFRSKKVENGKIVGDLTMHGVTKEVEFEFVFHGISEDSSGNRRAGFSATTVLDRKDFGILFSRFFDRGGLLLSNTIFMIIEFQAILKT
jgi:polyisoprenoid-binding protein YceI